MMKISESFYEYAEQTHRAEASLRLIFFLSLVLIRRVGMKSLIFLEGEVFSALFLAGRSGCLLMPVTQNSNTPHMPDLFSTGSFLRLPSSPSL